MEFLVDFADFLVQRRQELLGQAVDHLVIVAMAIAITAVLGVALGVATYRTEAPRQAVLAVTATFLTLPSFAVFALLLTIFGLGRTSAVIGLIFYGLLPIVRNTVAGLRNVDQAVVESAKGMGLTPVQQLLRIELPLAWPVIITGVRVSTQLAMGITAIAAAINAPGFGQPIFSGLARIGSAVATNLALAGTLGIIVLALLADGIFQVIDRLTTSKGIR